MRLAQLDRAFGYGPKGRGFESSNARYKEVGILLYKISAFLFLDSGISVSFFQRAGADTGYKVAILAEGNAAKREDILFLGRLPLFRKNEGGVYEMI